MSRKVLFEDFYQRFRHVPALKGALRLDPAMEAGRDIGIQPFGPFVLSRIDETIKRRWIRFLPLRLLARVCSPTSHVRLPFSPRSGRAACKAPLPTPQNPAPLRRAGRFQ